MDYSSFYFCRTKASVILPATPQLLRSLKGRKMFYVHFLSLYKIDLGRKRASLFTPFEGEVTLCTCYQLIYVLILSP